MLGIIVPVAAVIQKLKFAHGVVGGILVNVRHANAETVIAVRGHAELKPQNKVPIGLLRAEVSAATRSSTICETLQNARLRRIDTICLHRTNPSREILAVEERDESVRIRV